MKRTRDTIGPHVTSSRDPRVFSTPLYPLIQIASVASTSTSDGLFGANWSWGLKRAFHTMEIRGVHFKLESP
jgi:hypothetical protein